MKSRQSYQLRAACRGGLGQGEVPRTLRGAAPQYDLIFAPHAGFETLAAERRGSRAPIVMRRRDPDAFPGLPFTLTLLRGRSAWCTYRSACPLCLPKGESLDTVIKRGRAVCILPMTVT